MNYSRNLNVRTLVVLFGSIALFSLIIFANFIVIAGVPFYFIMLILGGLFLFLIKKEKIFFVNTQECFIFLFMFWLLIPVLHAYDVLLSFQQYYYYIISFSLFFLIRRFCFSNKDWFFLGNAILLGGIITSVVMIVKWDVILQGDRVGIDGINANYLAYSLVTLLPLLYIFLCQNINNKKYYLFLALFSLAIFLTGSRGAFIALLIFCMLLSFKKPMFGVVIVSIVFFCSAALLSLYDSLPQYWQARFDFQNSGSADIDWTSGRDVAWSLAWSTFNDNFMLGIGPHNFANFSGLGIGVHNVFLSLLVETGILGFIFYFLILASIVFFIIRRNFYLGLMFISIELPIFFTGVWESSPVLWSVLSLLMAYVVLFPENKRGG